MNIEIAAAARRGGAMLPQTRGGIFRVANGQLCACFMGAVLLGEGLTTVNEVAANMKSDGYANGRFIARTYNQLHEKFPELLTVGDYGEGRGIYQEYLTTLNDYRELSIEEIACKVEADAAARA